MRSVCPHEGKHLTQNPKNKPLPLDLVNNFSVWFLTGIQAGFFFFFNNTLMMKHRDAMYYFNKTYNYYSTSRKFLMSERSSCHLTHSVATNKIFCPALLFLPESVTRLFSFTSSHSSAVAGESPNGTAPLSGMLTRNLPPEHQFREQRWLK